MIIMMKRYLRLTALAASASLSTMAFAQIDGNVSITINPTSATSTTGLTVGAVGPVDSSMTVLDASAQLNLRNSGSLGANDVAAQSLNNCGVNMTNAAKASAQIVMIASTPADPLKAFNGAIGRAMAAIETLGLAVEVASDSMASGFGDFTDAAFTALLDGLMDELMSQIVDKITQEATDAFNNSVNNAINTLNTGVNNDGMATLSVAAGIKVPPPTYTSATTPAQITLAANVPLFSPSNSYISNLGVSGNVSVTGSTTGSSGNTGSNSGSNGSPPSNQPTQGPSNTSTIPGL